MAQLSSCPPRGQPAAPGATQGLIAALNSIEPQVMKAAALDVLYADYEWVRNCVAPAPSISRDTALTVSRKRLATQNIGS